MIALHIFTTEDAVYTVEETNPTVRTSVSPVSTVVISFSRPPASPLWPH